MVCRFNPTEQYRLHAQRDDASRELAHKQPRRDHTITRRFHLQLKVGVVNHSHQTKRIDRGAAAYCASSRDASSR